MKRRLINALPLAAIALILALIVPRLMHRDAAPNSLTVPETNIPQSRPTSLLTENWKVIRVADGDTITVTRGSLKEKIRFCGIDAPEVKHGDEPGQPLGQESKANLQRLIDEAGGIVQLEVVDSDRYGRQVAEVFTVLRDGSQRFLQEEQVKSGLAYHYAKYSGNCPHRDAIVSAQAIGQTNHAGVWGGNYEKPWDYRKSQR
jgi:endonuclease YncB( thermonuclease family)